LVIRAIRDYFNSDIGDILIDTDDIYEQAQQFMSHVMPEFAPRVKRYRDDAPLFSRFQIEHQIESAYARTVQLPSGGAIVIDHTEALVSVDVNSARAIKGGDIEETATRTNLEAADEVARQMRLRDLGGLIVIDFIDMEESRNRRDVENRLRDALRQDRARVQFGAISKFGLLEMSRQRLKPALSEGSSIPCPRCGGSGHVRDTESSALQILRIIQEESMKDNTAAVHAQVPVEVASFLLNEKRPEIAKIELKQRINVLLVPNKSLETPHYKLERLKHDDPRLDNIEASYTMAEEVEDPTTVTRRSQEPTNRQTPVIKGVLPDAPAPAAVPKAEASKPAKPPVKTEVKAEVSGGFFGWLKRLFAGGETTAKEDTNQTVGKRGDRASKEGERSERGERGGERRGGRGGRGGRRGDRNDRNEGSTERNDKGERQGDRSENNDARPPRENNGNRRGDRSGPRGDRRENAQANNVNETQIGNSDSVEAGSTEGRNDSRNDSRTERAPRGEGRRERGEGRRERGGERGERRNESGRQNTANENTSSLPTPQTEMSFNAEASENGTESAQSNDNRQDGNQGTPEKRERRSRDRYGRDRRERQTNNDNSAAENSSSEVVNVQTSNSEDAPAPRSYFERANAQANPETTPAAHASANPVEPAVSAGRADATPASSTAVPAGLPKVQKYELPISSLIQVAESSGLKWVNSDPEKIAQVQAAIAAEPKPVHVPRERPPAVVFDEGPLILVETRKDLADMKLPF
jgi:ribonuclease E